MITKEISPAEDIIVTTIRDELRPFEEVRITKDKSGKMDTYILLRSQKMIVSNSGVTHTRLQNEKL